MKKVSSALNRMVWSLVVAGALLAGRETKAQSAPALEVGMYRIQGTMKMNLMMQKKDGERVTVTVYDSKGKRLHEKLIGKRHEKYSLKIDFAEVSDGMYSIQVESGGEKIVKNVRLITNEVVETHGRTLVAVN